MSSSSSCAPCEDGSRVIDDGATRAVLRAEAKGVNENIIRSGRHALHRMMPGAEAKLDSMYEVVNRLVRELMPDAPFETRVLESRRVLRDMGFTTAMTDAAIEAMEKERKEEESVKTLFHKEVADVDLEAEVVRYVNSKNARLSLIQWLTRAAGSSCEGRGATVLHGMNIASSLVLLLQKLEPMDVSESSMELVWKLFLKQAGDTPEAVERVVRVLQGVDIRMRTAGPMMW